jgi:hypothetical protein
MERFKMTVQLSVHVLSLPEVSPGRRDRYDKSNIGSSEGVRGVLWVWG